MKDNSRLIIINILNGSEFRVKSRQKVGRFAGKVNYEKIPPQLRDETADNVLPFIILTGFHCPE